jgi:hypothetical protein
MTEPITQEEVQCEEVISDNTKYQTKCPECKEVLSRGSFFCANCDPLGIPDDDPLGGLSGFQAFLRIGVILSLFLAIVVFKYDLSMDDVMQVIDPDSVTTVPIDGMIDSYSAPAKDADFAITNFINTNSSNIRSTPSTKADVVVKADKGDVVKILERQEKWSQVEIKGKKGWVANSLLSSEVR